MSQHDAEAPTPTPVSLSPSDLTDASREVLVHGATDIVNAARASPDHEALAKLDALRQILLMRNERAALAMTLKAQGELARDLNQPTTAARAFDTEWGVRELLKQPFRAHRARLDHAEALFFAGMPDEAEGILRKAQQPARDLALGGKVQEASVQLADTLARLAGLLQARAQHEEAALWLEGAVDIAPDADTKAMVRATPDRFIQSRPRTRSL